MIKFLVLFLALFAAPVKADDNCIAQCTATYDAKIANLNAGYNDCMAGACPPRYLGCHDSCMPNRLNQANDIYKENGRLF